MATAESVALHFLQDSEVDEYVPLEVPSPYVVAYSFKLTDGSVYRLAVELISEAA